MQTTSFTKNPNGKLTCNNFSTMRAFNPEKYHNGAEHTILYKGNAIGVAKVYATIEVDINAIPDLFAWLDAGLPTAKYKAMLQRMYPSATKLNFVVYHWVSRDIQAHADIIAAHWQNILQQNVDVPFQEYLAK